MKKFFRKTTAIIMAVIIALVGIMAGSASGVLGIKAKAADTSLEAMRSRAEAIVNYTWTPAQRIYTWNGNSYNGKTYFEAGETVKGVPYTLFTSEVVSWSLLSLEQYKSKAASNYSATANCVSVGASRTGPVYGSCCADLICEVFGGKFMNGSSMRYHNVGAIENSDYGTTTYNVPISKIEAGDALSNTKGTHIIWVGEVTDTQLVIYEQTPPVARKVTVNKSSSTNSSGYFVFGGLVYNIVTKSNEFSGSSSTHTHSYTSSVTPATCTSGGYTTYTCSCTDSYTSDLTPALGHNYSKETIQNATCTSGGIVKFTCTRCTDSYNVPTTALGHDYTEKVIKRAKCLEEGTMLYTCTRCADSYTKEIPATGHSVDNPIWVTTVKATCEENGEQAGYCRDCGLIINTRTVSATGHDNGVRKVDYEATDEHDGQMSRYCTKCGKALETTTFKKHTHTLGYEAVLREATCCDSGLSGQFCKECNACYATEEISAKGHGEKVWVTSVPASCTKAGEMTAYCKDCGKAIDTKTIPADNHNEGVWIVSVPAECSRSGEKLCYCTACGEVTSTEEIPALTHEASNWRVSVKPTCTEKGEEISSCTICGETLESREIPALNHDEGVWTVSIKATCTEAGEEICTCTRCGKIIDKKEIKALGHDNGVWKVDFEATPDHEGQMTRYCSACNKALETKTFNLHTHTEGYRHVVIAPGCLTKGEGGVFCASCGVMYATYEIEELGHSLSAWFTNNDGTHSRTCTRCHDKETNNCNYIATVIPPTCTEGGYTTYVCDVCSHTYVSDYTDALGHDWGAWVDDENGESHTKTCLRCGETETQLHNWTEWTFNDDACLFKNGTKTRECPDCGASQTEEAHHTSWICRIIYPALVFIGNIVHKLIYLVSLNWLFPELTIKVEM